MYNLSSTKLLPWVASLLTLVTLAELNPTDLLYCIVQGLKYVPVACIIGCQFLELICCMLMSFGGAPNSNVADSLQGA